MSRPSEAHTHRCATCGTVYECDGDLVPAEQADGYLKAVCDLFHRHGLTTCESCQRDDREA